VSELARLLADSKFEGPLQVNRDSARSLEEYQGNQEIAPTSGGTSGGTWVPGAY